MEEESGAELLRNCAKTLYFAHLQSRYKICAWNLVSGKV